MIRSVAIWSVQDLSWRKPACWSRRTLSRADLILSRMILARTFPWIESSMTPSSCCRKRGRLSLEFYEMSCFPAFWHFFLLPYIFASVCLHECIYLIHTGFGCSRFLAWSLTWLLVELSVSWFPDGFHQHTPWSLYQRTLFQSSRCLEYLLRFL